jgi:hypothetical protein
MMRRYNLALLILAVIALCPAMAAANSIFVDVSGITGETPVPGFPGALAAQSITIGSNGFSVVRRVDVATPKIVDAVAKGTTFPDATALFYNVAPTASPDGTLSFQDVLASGYEFLGGLFDPLERDSFVSATRYSMFLELPGITGEGMSPGPPGSMEIDSFSLDGPMFSVVRRPDTATSKIAEDVAKGTVFSSATLLFFDSANAASPALTLIFQDVVASSFQLGGLLSPVETDGFAFGSLTEPRSVERVPEPSSALLLITGFSLAGGLAGRRQLIGKRR